jgi:hypothetical protein
MSLIPNAVFIRLVEHKSHTNAHYENGEKSQATVSIDGKRIMLYYCDYKPLINEMNEYIKHGLMEQISKYVLDTVDKTTTVLKFEKVKHYG